MKNRISDKFSQLRRENRGGFIPFIMAGDPSLGITEKLVMDLASTGASVIELGVPFSDPVADGPTIQRSAERALLNSVNVQGVLDLVRKVRDRRCNVPIILFSYFNPILQYGVERYAQAAEKAGVDGILITDLVAEEAADFSKLLSDHNQSLITLAAPTTTETRLKKILSLANGFIYAVSRAGVTGARTEISTDAQVLVERIRKYTDLPVAVGFGISTGEQVAEVCRYADAAVVGSAIVGEIMRLAPDPSVVPNDFMANMNKFTARLVAEGAETGRERAII
jgi:tryptophan synthase alpha chain